MLIREIVKEDIIKVADIHVKSWKEAYKDIMPADFLAKLAGENWRQGLENYFKIEVSNRFNKIYVAQVGEEIVGDIIFGEARDNKFDCDGEVYAINILPKYQKQGIGGKLLDKALEELKKNYSKIYLKVIEQNVNARSFYQHKGFENSGIVVKNKIANFEISELIYKKKLSSK